MASQTPKTSVPSVLSSHSRLASQEMRRSGASVPRTVTNRVTKATTAATRANADSTWRKSSQSYRLTASELVRRLHGLRDRDLGLALGAAVPHHGCDGLVSLEELLELLAALPLVHHEHEAVAHRKAVVEAAHAPSLLGDGAELVALAREEVAEAVGVSRDADCHDDAHMFSSCSWERSGPA